MLPSCEARHLYACSCGKAQDICARATVFVQINKVDFAVIRTALNQRFPSQTVYGPFDMLFVRISFLDHRKPNPNREWFAEGPGLLQECRL
jgi:hypothetical protein